VKILVLWNSVDFFSLFRGLSYRNLYHYLCCGMSYVCVGNVSYTCTILGYEPPRFLSYTCDNWLTRPRIEIELKINEDNPRYPTSVFWREFSRRRSYFFNVSLVGSAQSNCLLYLSPSHRTTITTAAIGWHTLPGKPLFKGRFPGKLCQPVPPSVFVFGVPA